jgi:hypothetical protein
MLRFCIEKKTVELLSFYVRVYARLCVCTHVYAYMHACMYVCMRTHACACVSVRFKANFIILGMHVIHNLKHLLNIFKPLLLPIQRCMLWSKKHVYTQSFKYCIRVFLGGGG